MRYEDIFSKRTTVVTSLSIVVPTTGKADALEQTLLAVLENRPPNCEILLLNRTDYDDPYELDGEVQFVQLPAGSSLVESLQQATAAASGEIIHWLAAGSEVQAAWESAALEQFQNPDVGFVAPLLVESERAKILAAGLGYHPAGKVLFWGKGRAAAKWQAPSSCQGCCWSGAFWRREALQAVGGLASDLGLHAGCLDLGLRIRTAGWQGIYEPKSQITQSAEMLAEEVSAYRQAIASERLFWRNRRGGWHPLAQHGLLMFAEGLRQCFGGKPFSHLTGRLVGACWKPQAPAKVAQAHRPHAEFANPSAKSRVTSPAERS